MQAPLVPAFTWHDEFSVGHGEMDGTHREFVDCVDALLTVDDAGLGSALAAFEVHARQHFADEDRWMAQSAYDNARCHVDEHAAVLKSLQEVQAALAQGRHAVVRSFAVALADWFPEHARVMDQGLALWLTKQRLGGAPVQLQRKPRSVTA